MQDEGHLVQLRADVNSLEHRSASARKRACFVIDARGWCKDMDLYTKDGDTVEPLPGVRSAAAQELQRRYTTRYQSGR